MNPEYTKLTTKNQQKLDWQYPSLLYQKACGINSNTNLIIDDVGLDNEDQQRLRQLSINQLLFLDPSDLMPKVSQSVNESIDNDSLILMVREGGLKIKNRLLQKPKTLDILISRNPNEPREGRNIDSINKQLLLDTLVATKPEKIAVIDDVAVSGATAEFIQEFTQSKLGITYFWSLSVWLMAFPRNKQSQSGIKGYSQTTAALVYAGELGRTPVNTLWDWFYNPLKKQIVVPNYAQRYSNKPAEFENLVDQLANKYQEQSEK